MSFTVKPNVAIYGSCVSRDTFDASLRGQANLVEYVARQCLSSLDSVFRVPKTFDIKQLESQFQRRMVAGDIRGNGLRKLKVAHRSKGLDVLLWDLTDERCGYYTSEDGGIVTRSQEAIASQLFTPTPESWNLVTFGSLEHRMQFMVSAARFRRRLKALGLWSKVLVLAAPWAQFTVQGEPTPVSYGFTAHRANKIFNEYYEYLRADGWQVVGQDINVEADSSHRWGPAPFHYSLETYEHLASAIKSIFPSIVRHEAKDS